MVNKKPKTSIREQRLIDWLSQRDLTEDEISWLEKEITICCAPGVATSSGWAMRLMLRMIVEIRRARGLPQPTPKELIEKYFPNSGG